MKSLLKTIILLVAFPFASLGQSELKINETTFDSIVPQLGNCNSDTIVVLWETPTTRVFASWECVSQKFDYWTRHTMVESDAKLFSRIKTELSNCRIASAYEIARDSPLEERLRYVIGELLTDGDCFVTELRTNEKVPVVRVQYYRHEYYNGGRRFFVGEELLFENVEWMY